MLTTPKGIRRNNPLNLMRTDPRQGWAGAVADDALGDDREEAFIAPFWGLRAAAVLLLNDQQKRGQWTVREVFSHFAPPIENDTDAYIRNMAAWMQVDPDQRIDLRDPELLLHALQGATRQENGEQPYSDELMRDAINAARKSVGAMTTTQA